MKSVIKTLLTNKQTRNTSLLSMLVASLVTVGAPWDGIA